MIIAALIQLVSYVASHMYTSLSMIMLVRKTQVSEDRLRSAQT